MSGKTVRGRYAPTPSGRMHLGNVFCALLAWLSAKSQGGEMVLRMEDLDRSRCREEYVKWLLDDLRYLGLTFDEGPEQGGDKAPYTQSERTSYYERILAILEQSGQVYPCYCSRDELHAPNAPHTSDGRVIYSGTCRHLSAQERAAKTRLPAYRLIASEADCCFEDGLYGPQRFSVAEEWGDFLVRRSDGVFAYQLAVVADDAAMGITEVVRGRDLLSSTAPQCQLYDMLGVQIPRFIHVPMLVAPDGRRLSKRDRDLDLGELRERFPSAEPLIGMLLYWAGVLDIPRPINTKEALSIFSWDKVVKKDIVVSKEKLSQYIV